MKHLIIIALILGGFAGQAQTGSIYHDVGYAMPVQKKATHELPVWVGPTLIVAGVGISTIGWVLLRQMDFNNPVTIYGPFALAAGGAALSAIGIVITKKILDHRKREKKKYNRIY